MVRRWLAGPWGGLLLAVAVAALLRYAALGWAPPGLAFDEAGNGIAAMDVAQGGYRLWWPIGGGAEPLMAYLLQPFFWLFGPTSLALRLYSATMGVVTVAGTYWLARELFAVSPVSEGDSRVSSWLPLFAALGLATAFWHAAFSRVAFRALAMPAVEVLALAWLWRALRSSEPRERRSEAWFHYAGAGALVGLGMYTYPPGRFVPLMLILFFAVEAGLAWLRDLQPLIIRHAKGLSLSALAAVLVVSPLLVFFVQHPEAFFERASAVSVFNPIWNQGDLGGTLLRVTLTTLGTFAALTGDPNPIANLPGRPMLGPFLALFFWVGLIVSLWRVVRYAIGNEASAPSASSRPNESVSSPDKTDRLSIAAYVLLLSWWLVMLLPGILAPEGAPHHLRIIGTAPATYVLAAVGLSQISNLQIYKSTNQQISKSANQQTLALPIGGLWLRASASVSKPVEWLVVVMFLLIGLVTARDYFGRWVRLPELYMTYDVYALELADQMTSEMDPAAVFVIPMDLRAGHEARHYTLDFLYRGATPYYYLPVDETTAAARLTEAAAGHKTLRVVRWLQDKHADADEREVVTFLLARAARLVVEETHPVYRIETWSLPSADTTFTLPTIETDAGATFGGVLRLEGVDLSVTGDTVAVALRWAPLAAMDADYKASLRLIAADGGLAAQKDRFLRHNWHQVTRLWPAETVNEYYVLPPVPPGEYEVRLVVYHPQTLATLSADVGAEVSLGRVRVE